MNLWLSILSLSTMTAMGKQFNKTLDAMFGANRTYTIEQFERAYQVCCANNSLELDRAEIAKQEQAAAKERAKAARAKRAVETRVYTEAEKEEMSLRRIATARRTAKSKKRYAAYW